MLPKFYSYLPQDCLAHRAHEDPVDPVAHRARTATLRRLDAWWATRNARPAAGCEAGEFHPFGAWEMVEPSGIWREYDEQTLKTLMIFDVLYLVGGFNNLKKYESQCEGFSHILWKITNLPNHQPHMVFLCLDEANTVSLGIIIQFSWMDLDCSLKKKL